ncbi:ABC transporter permease [Methanopyrus kandleri]|uniref:ABC-type multidrug transport system, permease subunit n=2 Tax=Methanopyrus kandleri TaxID=2320 RepID=Q8TWT9_METKA|nr:ABC transporter permease [Methanopyrus kandleri]AAM02156.1 ABC-type multidrug transport system, permease subunit [Methanopyrus kandleri AV19]HII69825.1 ABC transporter permease [Methanopyrus kandleri]
MSWRVIAVRDLRAWLKDRRRLAPTLIMPVITILVMYGAFHDVKPRHVTVAVLSHSSDFDPVLDALKSDDRVGVVHVRSVDEGKTMVKEGRAVVFVYVPKGFPSDKATVYYDPSDPMGSNYVRGVIQRAWVKRVSEEMKKVVRDLQAAFRWMPAPQPPISRVPGNPFDFEAPVKGLKYFDFLVPGLVVLTATMGSIFGMGRVMMEEIETGVTYALFAAPIRPRDVVIGRFLNMSLWGAVRCGIVLVTALALGAKVPHPFLLLGVGILSTATMIGFALLMASLAGRSEVAEMLTGALTTPMMFLSGIFMPPSVMPEWAYEVARVNPMYYMGDAARKAALLGYLDPVDIAVLVVFATVFIATGAMLYDRIREHL